MSEKCNIHERVETIHHPQCTGRKEKNDLDFGFEDVFKNLRILSLYLHGLNYPGLGKDGNVRARREDARG